MKKIRLRWSHKAQLGGAGGARCFGRGLLFARMDGAVAGRLLRHDVGRMGVIGMLKYSAAIDWPDMSSICPRALRAALGPSGPA